MLSRNCYCGYFWSDTDNLKTKQNQHSHSKQTKHKQLPVNSPYLAGFQNPGVNDRAKAFTLSVVKVDANVVEKCFGARRSSLVGFNFSAYHEVGKKTP